MTTQARGNETRTRILDAAEACFAQHGYDATGLAEICRRADVSKGAFYHHFPTKQAVFLELFRRWLEGIDAGLAAARAGAANAEEAFDRMLAVAQQVFAAGQGRLPIFLEFWTQAAHDPAIWQATIEPYRRYQAFFADLIRSGVAEGTFRPICPEVAAQALVSLAAGLVLQGLIDPQGADWGQVMQQAIGMFLQGMRRDGEGR